MNHIYKTIWSEALGAWVAVSELSKNQGKGGRSRKVVSAAVLGTAILATQNGYAASGITCTEDNTSTTEQKTVTCVAHNNGNNWYNKNEKPIQNYTLTLSDPQIAALRAPGTGLQILQLINIGGNYTNNNTTEGTISFVANKFDTITTSNASQPRSIFLGTLEGGTLHSKITLEGDKVGTITTNTKGASESFTTDATGVSINSRTVGNAEILMNTSTGKIISAGESLVANGQVRGIHISQEKQGYAKVTMQDGSINASDAYDVYGISAQIGTNSGDGNSEIEVEGGTINVSNGRNTTLGITAIARPGSGVNGNATVKLTGGTITSHGANAQAILAIASSTSNFSQNQIHHNFQSYSGANSVSVTQSGGKLTARGSGTNPRASGIVAVTGTKGSAVVTQTGGNITVQGQSSSPDYTDNGIYARSFSGIAEITQTENGAISVSGSNTNGITAISDRSDVKINIDGNLESKQAAAIDSRTQQARSYRKDLGTSRITIGDHASITAPTLIKNDDGHSKITIAKNATLGNATLTSGEITLEGGNDHLTFNGTDISNLSEINGGIDAEINGDNDFDTITFNNYGSAGARELDLQPMIGNKLVNWERYELGKGKYTLSSDSIDVANGTSADGEIGGLAVIDGGELSFKKDKFTINGGLHVDQGGILNLRRGAGEFSQVIVEDNYHGGGTILFNTELGEDKSPTDKLTIKGNVYGKTNVKVANADGKGGETTKDGGIKLIELGDTSTLENGADSFQLQTDKNGAYPQAGAFEYNKLVYIPKKKGFFLRSKAKSSGSTGNTTSGNNTSGDNNDTNNQTVEAKPALPKQPELYRPAVSSYVMAQASNISAASSILGNHLHQRMGEQQNSLVDNADNQAWGRIRTESQSLKGKRQFDLDNDTQLIQFGWDLTIDRDNQNSHNHTGLYIAYAKNNANFFDRNRGTQKVSSLNSDIISLGAYHTRFDEDGNYIDLIGGLHHIDNKYSDIYQGKAKQNAWGISASAEAGWHKDLGNGFFIEPQAQITAQTSRYGSFNDDISSINQYNSNSLRPRIGVRTGFNDQKNGKDGYLTASIIHEVLAPAKVTIGGTGVTEAIGKDTWLEIGIGGQLPISNNSTIYGSAQYHHTLGDSSRRGGSGQIGIRFSW